MDVFKQILGGLYSGGACVRGSLYSGFYDIKQILSITFPLMLKNLPLHDQTL